MDAVEIIKEAAGANFAQDDRGNIVVHGNLNLWRKSLTALPDHLTVEGNLTLPISLTALPDNLSVGGSLRETPRCVALLPKNLFVRGDLDLAFTKIAELPDNFSVGGSLNLVCTPLASLPGNLSVGGNLALRGANIHSLPDNLSVGGLLDLRDTKISSLPDDLSVGSLDVTNTPLKELPPNFAVSGSLNLNGTKIESLPDNFSVSGDLLLGHTPMTALPANLSVGGSLCFPGEFFDMKMLDGVYVGGVISLSGEPNQVRELPIFANYIAWASDPMRCLKRRSNRLDLEGHFAEWVAAPEQAAEEVKQATPHWNGQEHEKWRVLLHGLSGWKEANQIRNPFPLDSEGAAYSFQTRARNNAHYNVTTPFTTSITAAKDYLAQIKRYFTLNQDYFSVGYCWEMRTCATLTEAEALVAENHTEELAPLVRLLLEANNPYWHNFYKNYLRNSGACYIFNVRSPSAAFHDERRKDAAFFETYTAPIHADIDIDYLFICLDIIRQVTRAPEYIQPVRDAAEKVCQRFGLQRNFNESPPDEERENRRTQYEESSEAFRAAVNRCWESPMEAEAAPVTQAAQNFVSSPSAADSLDRFIEELQIHP